MRFLFIKRTPRGTKLLGEDSSMTSSSKKTPVDQSATGRIYYITASGRRPAPVEVVSLPEEATRYH
jgi:hypothetical protein